MLRRFAFSLAFFITLALVLAACGPGRLPEQVIVSLTSDGETQELTLPQGSTVRDALRSASVTLAELDRVRPPETSLLRQRHGHHRDARHSDQRTSYRNHPLRHSDTARLRHCCPAKVAFCKPDATAHWRRIIG